MEFYTPILLSILAALGLREVVPFIVRWFFNRSQTNLELEEISLTNTDKKLKGLQDVIAMSEELMIKFQAQVEVIAALKEDKILDKQKIDYRDGVVEYQKNELKSLHSEIITLRANETRSLERIMQLEERVGKLEKENKELVGL
jgi:hypothetical protein